MEPTEKIEKKDGNNSIAVGVVAVALIALLAIGAYKSMNKPTLTSEVQKSATETPSMEVKPTESVENVTYKDGTYNAVGNYVSPAGPEQIDVSLTIKQGVVIASEVVSKATAPKSKNYQGIFVDNYKSQVIGKNISDLMLTKVSGSSLTPKGFNDALDKIKVEAKS